MRAIRWLCEQPAAVRRRLQSWWHHGGEPEAAAACLALPDAGPAIAVSPEATGRRRVFKGCVVRAVGVKRAVVRRFLLRLRALLAEQAATADKQGNLQRRIARMRIRLGFCHGPPSGA